MEVEPIVVVLVLAVTVIPAFFCIVLKVISIIGGWTELASVYRTTEPMPEARLFMQSAMLNYMMGYNRCLTLGVTADALYLRVFILSFGHRPLRLPWAEADVKREVRRFGFEYTALTFAQVPNVTIHLRSATAEQLIGMASQARAASAGD